MPQYRLHYFNARGRAELPRLIFKQAGVEFEDVRFELSEWPTLKSTMPFGQVPVLEVDGKFLAQSNTIARYLARRYNLVGEDEWEQAQADQYADCIADLINGMDPAFLENDPEKQKELFAKYLTESAAPYIVRLEKILEKNGSDYLVGKKVTWADLAFYFYFDFLMEKFGQDVLKGAPKLRELVNRIGNLPNIKAWVESRPKTDI